MSVIEAMVGKELITKDGIKSTKHVIEGKQVIGLFLSGHWCPPDKKKPFTPDLVQIYKACIEENKSFEIIFISSDKNQKEFDEYYREMPWTAIPYGRRDINTVYKKYRIQEIPTLILLNTDGSVISKDGRSLLTNKSDGFPWK